MRWRTRSSLATDVDHRNVAAMRVHENELAASGARDAVADLGPRADDRLDGKRERAGIFDMLVGLADRLDGQDQDRHIVRDSLDRCREIALVDEHIDPDRQVRPMLLDRGDRQNRDDFAHVGGGEIAPAHLGPELGRQHADLPGAQGARAATASISTLNSGRAKP